MKSNVCRTATIPGLISDIKRAQPTSTNVCQLNLRLAVMILKLKRITVVPLKQEWVVMGLEQEWVVMGLEQERRFCHLPGARAMVGWCALIADGSCTLRGVYGLSLFGFMGNI
ncbi:unnamed protein product [Camellia sinensis]